MPFGSDVTMKSIAEQHLYSADGKEYPSVTTVLDALGAPKSLMKWANGLGRRGVNYEDELNRTAVQGTFVHEINQCIVDPEAGHMPTIKDPLVDYYVRKRVQNFQYTLKQHEGQWKTIFTETPFVSHTYRIGGTMDWFTDWYGKKTLFDFKTSSAVRPKHLMQLGGYRLILSDNDIDIDQAGIILCKQDRCQIFIFDISDVNHFADIFINIRDYYDDSAYLSHTIYTAENPKTDK